MSGVTRIDKIRKEYIGGNLDIMNITEKMKQNRLRFDNDEGN